MPSLFDESSWKERLFLWAARQLYCVLLDSCGTNTDRYGKFEWILAVTDDPESPVLHTVAGLGSSLQNNGGHWWFGAFSYEAQGGFEPRLRRLTQAFVDVPEIVFFQPKWVLACRRGQTNVDCLFGDLGSLEELVRESEAIRTEVAGSHGLQFNSNFNEPGYLSAVSEIREWIREGHTYELNLTQCFRSEGILQDPFGLWQRLKAVSPVPFAGFGKWTDLYLLCTSPERFLQLEKGLLRSQPIKGTTARHDDPVEDAKAAELLRSSEKERAENVMIVDLSRNDLHRVCETGSVKVPALFEVQAFRQVHHLVSTVEGRLRKDISPIDAFGAAFPPGSMTGAPKIRTCELIEEVEQEGRGLYSGCLGYFAPDGSFDFNVVIRSLVYDEAQKRLSYHVGGAITWDSHPEEEYAESLLKAKGILQVLGE